MSPVAVQAGIRQLLQDVETDISRTQGELDEKLRARDVLMSLATKYQTPVRHERAQRRIKHTNGHANIYEADALKVKHLDLPQALAWLAMQHDGTLKVRDAADVLFRTQVIGGKPLYAYRRVWQVLTGRPDSWQKSSKGEFNLLSEASAH